MNKTSMTIAALFAIVNLSGCVLVMAGGSYHSDHGDLVSEDGTIRYVGWCNVHPHYSRCGGSAAAAARPDVAAASVEPEPTSYR